ncbi:MAG: prepilin-type N-terminal cleavage/methylation domain-containing protein [Rickettsiales bacterium]
MKNTNNPKLNNSGGFTLIELSIVLVIIGLIVSGVLVGQYLVKAAEVRATIAQYEKYNASMNAFRTRFNALPGDLTFAEANSFGINPAAGSLTVGGNGNGLVESTSSSNLNAPVSEPLLIWQQLTAANLIDGSYGTAITTAAQMAASPTPDLYFPSAKTGRGGVWLAGSSGGLNYYVIANVTGVTTGGAGTATYATAVGGAITPVEAFNIDSKIDDGLPNTGIVQARGHATMSTTADTLFAALGGSSQPTWTNTTGASGDCVIGTSATATNDTYNRSTATGGDTPACSLRMRFN